MPFERKATNGRNLGAYESSERNGPSSAKVNLVHAHPRAALGAVSHDAIVAGKRDYGTGGKAVTVDGSDGWNCMAVPISVEDVE